MNIKKIICFALSLVMALCLSACGGSGSSGGATGQSEEITSLSWEEVKETLPDDASGKTIEFYTWNELTTASKKVVENFTKETGIKVTVTVEPYDTYMSKLASRVAAKNSPDVMRVREEAPMWCQYLQPITSTGFNFNDSYWDQSVLEAYTFNGNIFAANMTNSPYYQPVICMYNTELIKKFGLEDPYELWKSGEWTYDKLHEIASKFVEKAGDGYNGISLMFGEYAYSVGCPPISFDGSEYVSNLQNANYIKAAQYMNKAYHDGVYDRNIGNTTGFDEGKVLFYFDAEIGLRAGHHYMRQLKNSNSVKAVPVPEVAGQEQYYQIMSETEAYGIPQNANNANLAPYFIRYYCDVNNYDMSEFYYDASTGEGSVYEVVQWTRDKQRVSNLLSSLMNDTAGFNYGYFNQTILTCGTSQIKSEIDSKFAQGLQASCDGANKILARMK